MILNPHLPIPIPFHRVIAWLAAIATLALSGCGEGKDNNPAATPPEKVELVEGSADLQALINRELAAGNRRIVIPPGRYRVQADRGSHLAFSNLSDVEIIAEQVELVCTSTVRAVWFDNCTNVTLRGLIVDYDPLPFTQGKIVAMAADKSWIDFVVAEGYPDNQLSDPVQIYDPETGGLRRGDGRWNDEVHPLGDRRYRVSKALGYRFAADEDTEQIGDVLVSKNAFGKPGSPHAVELRGSRGMRFEDITVFASPSFGFFERNCDGTTYLRCIVNRRAPEDDPVKRALPRMRSLNADAFHSKDAAKGPAILSCRAHFMGDDAVNINGRYHFVRNGEGRQLSIAIFDNKTTIKVGDPLQFLPVSGPRPPDATVVQRRLDSTPLTDEEKVFIRGLRMDARLRSDLLGGNAKLYTLTLDRDVSIKPGSLVCCPLRLGNGFAVKDCDFGDNRSRGILIKASNGEISGNRIINSRMAAVLVSPEFWWMEAGLSSDLMIRDNTIKGSRQTPIQIYARGGNRQMLPAGALRNISILDNRIEDCSWPLIHVTSTSDLTIKGNVLPVPPPKQGTTPDGKPINPILLENCEITEPLR